MSHGSTPCLTPDVHPSPNAQKRTRIPQACDRCRVKKARCAGGIPCGKCRRSNLLCVFGHKVEAYRRVYPKGYVEMLERQQKQLVAGIQVLYRKMTSGEAWVGDKALEHHNQPTVHDILAALNLLQPRKESDLHVQDFETCSSFLDDESPIDKIFSVASETRVRSLDHIHPTQLDDRSPPSEIELTLSMDFNGQQSRPEMDTTSVQSFMAMQSIVIQRQPESLSLDWISIPFGDGMIDQPAQMLDDQVHDLEISTLLGTVPAMSQPFISDIGPTSLTMASTYSRRGY